MSFTFPDPLITDEFTAANGITYLWDDDSAGPGKWVVKSFLHEGVLVDLSPIPPTRPDRPEGPNDGDLWFDTSPEELTLYVYSEDSGAWIPAAPPTTLEGRVAENEALQIQIVQRLQANDVLTNFHSSEIVTIKDDLTTIQNEIIELEEEIDAIAPSVERGIWKFNLGGVVGSRGQLTMYDGVNGSGSPIGLFTGAKSVCLNELDNDGTPHGFANVIAGDLIELFVQGDADYGLFNVVEVHDETQGAAQYWMIDVEFVRSLSATSKADNADDVRVKISKPPSGGDASSFVLKTGDEMAGPDPLVIKTTKTSISYNAAGSNTAFIRFQNDNNGTKRTTDLYLAGGNSSRLCVNYDFLSKGAVYSNGYFYAHNGTDASDAKIYLNSTSGNLRYGGINQLSWDASEITAFEAIKFDDLSKNTDSDHAIHKGYVDKAIQAAGLQLGSFNYKRNGDPFQSGHIRSNTSTNPANITQLEIHKTNDDGIAWGTELYEAVIRVKMYVHFVDKGVSTYTGRITNIEIMTNGVKLTLTPVTDLISGSVYLNNKYDLFISHNKFGFKYPV